MLTSIDVKFIFDTVRLGLSSSANILHPHPHPPIFLSPSELSSYCFCHVFSYYFLVPAVVLTLETSEMSAILFFTTKTTQPRPQVSSVNGTLTCSGLYFWRHFFVKHKILPNLVISNWLWWIMRVLLANQNCGNILNE